MSATPKCTICGYFHFESHGCYPTNFVEPAPDLATLLRELDRAALDTRTPDSDAEWLEARGVSVDRGLAVDRLTETQLRDLIHALWHAESLDESRAALRRAVEGR